MPVLMIARFPGEPAALKRGYDEVSAALEQQTGSATPDGVVRHACAVSGDALYIVDIWESREAVQAVLGNPEFGQMLESVGLPSPQQADVQVLELHRVLPPIG